MDKELYPDIVTLISDDGEEIEFEILDILENDEGKFYILLPYYADPSDALSDPGEYYIMESFEEDGEEQLTEIEDEEKLDRIASVFEEKYYRENFGEDFSSEDDD